MLKDELTHSPPSNEAVRNTAPGMGLLTIQNVVTGVMGFVFLEASIRLLPPLQYGVYSSVLVSATIGSTIGTFGLNQAMARYISYLHKQDESTSWHAARKILVLAFIFASIVTAVYSAAAPYLSLYFTKSTSSSGVFLLSGAYLFLSALASTSQGIIQGLKKYALLARMLFVSNTAMMIFGVVTLYLYRNITFAIIAWIISFAVVTGWTLSIAGRNLTRTKGDLEYSNIMKYSYPIGISTVVTVLASSVDVIIVGGYLNALSLGVYYLAVMISSNLAIGLMVPLTTTFLPEISSHSSDAEVSNGLRLGLRFITLAVLPLSLFVAAVPNQMITLYSGGGGYLAGSPSLELMTLFYLFLAMQTILVVIFEATGRTMNLMIIGITAVAINIGLAVLLVPGLGLLGAASAKISGGLVGASLGFYFARNYSKNLDRPNFYLKALAAAFIPFILTFILSRYVSVVTITLVPYTIIYSAVFFLCIKAFKILNDDDRTFVSHILPRSMHRILRMI